VNWYDLTKTANKVLGEVVHGKVCKGGMERTAMSNNIGGDVISWRSNRYDKWGLNGKK